MSDNQILLLKDSLIRTFVVLFVEIQGRQFNLARSHTFTEIDHELIFTVNLLSSADSRRIVVSYKRKYVQEVLVNRLVKPAQEKSVVR